ncbi:MAG: GNAT family N-acetyltransferase [Firmicutes bacterium]|nr:GNAT family N-acetyltransferase [Bacillota bacterium]
MLFERLSLSEEERIPEMSEMATAIVREHFDPIIGKAQNNYMIEKFQTVEAIRAQLQNGYQYYFVKAGGRNIGFLAFYPKARCMYLSKFYLYKAERGKGYAGQMLDFVIRKAREQHLPAVELHVNKNNSARYAYEKLGFRIAGCEKNDIGAGFYMDDYVYRLEI